MHKYAIIVAGGVGTRFGDSLPKQFHSLNGKSLLWHSVYAFTKAFTDIKFILVLPAGYLDRGDEIRQSFPGFEIEIIKGGDTRFRSVQNGISMMRENEAIVFVHDAVRSLVSPELIKRCYEGAIKNGSAIPAITATDSIRFENKVVDRSRVKIIQTPQTFKAEMLRTAFEQPFEESFTDEATVVERTGATVFFVEGEETNIKITRPVDVLIAEKLLLK